jgi:hypothetical protein
VWRFQLSAKISELQAASSNTELNASEGNATYNGPQTSRICWQSSGEELPKIAACFRENSTPMRSDAVYGAANLAKKYWRGAATSGTVALLFDTAL